MNIEYIIDIVFINCCKINIILLIYFILLEEENYE